MRPGIWAGMLLILALAIGPAWAQEPPPPQADAASAYIFNTLLFLIMGMTVMFMAAGFCMLEAGLVRAKNAATICLKNIALYAVAAIMTWAIGYHLIYGVAPGGFIAPLKGVWSAEIAAAPDGKYAAHSDWFFQMVFVATAGSIVSGALAERVKLWAFLAFTVVLTGVIYPIQASWEWGQGMLNAEWFTGAFGAPFSDFAGSTLVHATGGWAALAGMMFLGPRRGRYAGGRVHPMPGSALPLATLGTFILWFGWFGFNSGSLLSLGNPEDAQKISKIIVNTNMAACGGLLTALVATQFAFGKVDLTLTLNGAIGGLVSITAEPLTPELWQAIAIGAGGGLIVTFAVRLLDRLRLDDVVGAVPAHLLCGLWGTLIVAWTNPDATFLAQAAGMAMSGAFVFSASALVWAGLKVTMGIRVSPEDEVNGVDAAELGMEAWPEFANVGRGGPR